MFKEFLRKKCIHTASWETKGLRKSLTLYDLVSQGVGMIIGGGVFVTTGLIAGQHAGPAITISFLLAGIIIILIASCYAELHSLIPAGGIYSYSYAICGEVVAWIVICLFFLANILGCSFVVIGFSKYFISVLSHFSLHIPIELQHGYGTEILINGEVKKCIVNLPTAIVIGISTLILLRSVRVASSINNALVVIKIFVIVTFISCGYLYLNTDLWTPYIPDNSGIIGEFGWSGVMVGASMLLPAYNGFDVILSASQEAKQAQRDIPRAIVLCILISAVLYCATAATMTGLAHYKLLNVPNPISVAMHRMSIPGLGLAMEIGILITLFSVEIMSIYSITRIVLVTIHDGLLPKKLGAIDPKSSIPRNLTILVALINFVIVNLTDVKEVIELQSLCMMLIFILMCGMTAYLRYKESSSHRTFKVPFIYITLPMLFCAFVTMVTLLPLKAWVILIFYVTSMMFVYLLYGVKHSHLSDK